jgi:hypothetical protein
MITSDMTEQHKMEALNRAYVQAIAAKAGVGISTPQPDYALDLYLHRVIKEDHRIRYIGVALNCQLKASTDWKIDGNEIVYNLEAKTYNVLADASGPWVLILLCLPKDTNDWLELCEDYMRIRKCCYYWQNLEYLETQNSSSITIRIPRGQLLTPDSLIDLLMKVQPEGRNR